MYKEEKKMNPKLAKALKILGFGFIGLTGLGVVLAGISYLLQSPVEQRAFFAAQEGENQPLVFSHQGGEAIRPTNTMIAFRDSVTIGADVLDADMHMSSDGVLVLAHDETVDRTSNGTGEIRNLSIAELRELDFGHNFSTDGDQTFPYRGQGHGIVTVEELFDDFPNEKFGIEIKQTTTEAAEKFCTMIKDYGYEDQVLVSSFAQENMDVFREQCPSVATSATEDEVRTFYIYQLIGMAGFYNPPFQALQIPEYSGGTHVLNSGLAAVAGRMGLQIIPWTINEIEDFERLINDFELYGINTNYPDRLVDFLSRQ